MHDRGVLALAALAGGLACLRCVAVLGIDDPPPIAGSDGGTVVDGGTVDAGGYVNEVLADAPILYYRLDETSGRANSLGTADASGSYGSAIVRAVPGLLDSDRDLAASFPGADDAGQAVIVATPESAALEPSSAITVECWVKADSFDATMRIVSYGSDEKADAFEAWVLQVYMGTVSFYSGRVKDTTGSSAFATGTTHVAPGVHHILGTFDGSRMQVYLDGARDTLDGGLAATGALGNYDRTNGLAVGAGFSGGDGFKGTIDEVAVYDTALSEDRIRAHFLAAK